ncbi:MAG: endoflagellar motor protein [Deltaproteobacteria bacterium]|nr:MAG: endoflagellar motor protein [Deltaproteobacteria bacterium]
MNKAVFTALLLCACVPKGRYTEALDDKARLEAELEELQGVVADQDESLRRLQSQVEASQAALEETNRKLAAKIAEAGALAEDIEAMKQALAEAEMRKARADAALESYRDLVARFQALIDAGTLRVKIVDGRMVVELATDILFGAGSATVSKDGKAALLEVAEVLASIEGREYQVAGHTDDVPIATERFPSNWHLGAARAIAVVKVLERGGLGPERVSIASYSEFQPVDTNRTPDGKRNNRRIEIVVVPDLSDLPGYDELESLAGGNEI